jgi:hypothetical protein
MARVGNPPKGHPGEGRGPVPSPDPVWTGTLKQVNIGANWEEVGMPVVFISYSHDSEDHSDHVLALAQRLRTDGVDVRLDRYLNGGPAGGWLRWMRRQLKEAEFVLLVCSERYYRRFHGEEKARKGRGATREGSLIDLDIYDQYGETLKYVPVLLGERDEAFIPDPLRGHAHYLLTSEKNYQALKSFLAGKAGVTPAPLGTLEVAPGRTVEPLRFPGDGGDQRVEVSRLPRTAGELFGREERLAALEAAWEDPKIRIVTMVAWGGVGKTSLVAKFADRLAERGYDGADYFDWSFYSQGASDTSNASGDAFVDAALRFFGDVAVADSGAGAWEKGAHLAKLVAAKKTLLILDGLEPLQHPPGPLAGDWKDPGLQSLLRGLAQRNSGLCLVTTRERVTDLERLEKTVAPCWRLEHLSEDAGVELLKSLGVHGARTEMAEAVRNVHGHALTVSLLGRFLKSAHGGDVRRRDRVDFSDLQAIRGGKQAFRVIAAYEKWLAGGGEAGARQLALLRLLGLFDRLAANPLLAALRAAPAIVGLTEPLVGLDEAEWNLVVDQLEEASLVLRQEAGLDAHPLTREYFGEQVRERQENAFREAHGRLFDYLAEKSDCRPEGLTALQPLYQAVFHGCQAGRHQEAAFEIYFSRILRRNEFYSLDRLGAFGADLAAIACFFENPWSRLASSVSEADHGWLLNQAAVCLRALGRLREAIEPLRAGLERAAQIEAWNDASARAGNLSELEQTLGEVEAAVADAKLAVEFADRSGDVHQQLSKRARLAAARHQAGQDESALALFREAERMQSEHEPENPLLYSLSGFQYCDILLAHAERTAGSGRKAGESSELEECAEVERRATQSLEIAKRNNWLLGIALDHLSLGRSRLYQLILNGGSSGLADVTVGIEKAVADLRAAGEIEFIAYGLMTRAWLRKLEGNIDGARADLNEAQDIAQRGPMKLHLADVALYRARLFYDPEALAEARRLVEECGYGRRLPEIEDLEAVSGNWPP